MHNELDKILSRRAAPPEAPHGLAERVIHAAIHGRSKKWTIGDYCVDLWQGFTETFVLPAPAYALSLVLLTGFVLGISGQLVPTYAGSTGDDDMTTFGLANDSYENGHFL